MSNFKGPQTYSCFNCDKLDLLETDIDEEDYEGGQMTAYYCKTCGHPTCKNYREPREVDLTEPMKVMQSVKVTDKMIDDGDIPY